MLLNIEGAYKCTIFYLIKIYYQMGLLSWKFTDVNSLSPFLLNIVI